MYVLVSQHTSFIQKVRPQRHLGDDGGVAPRGSRLVCKLAVRGVASGLAYSRRVQALCARYGDYYLIKTKKSGL